jgi:YesN/AraC family two-component response regulator
MKNMNQKLALAMFLQRENFTPHHKYDEDMLPYEYIKNGDPRGSDEAVKMFSSNKVGKLSDNPLRNAKYMFVCAMTLTTRFAIEGGMDSETAYHTSDLYIQSADQCQSIEDVRKLHKNMIEYFVKQMSKIKNENIYSKQVLLCIDYIHDHLHQAIKIVDIAEKIDINASYLSTLFKKEMNLSVSEYIRRKRVEAAENMLRYSGYSLTEISQYLAFCSFSHFATIFLKYTGCTPKEYRKKYYRRTDIVNK